MNIVIIILGILYLCGASVGKGLAICAIIEGVLITVISVIRKMKED